MSHPVYDVTLPLRPAMPIWPGDPPVRIQPVILSDEKGAQVSELVLGSHSGTHVDAPAHLLASGRGVDELDLEALLGPAWVIYLPETAAITVKDLSAAVAAHGLDPDDLPPRLLLKTRNSDRAILSGDFTPDYVSLTVPAAHWLMAQGMVLLGIDALSVDPFDDPLCPVHHILLAHGVVIVEGLDLRGVTAGPYDLVCLPLRIPGGDGAPARVLLKG